MFKFKFVNDNGETEHIIAAGRKSAIYKYSQDKGCPIEYVKNHCLITNEGNVRNWDVK